MPGTGRNGVMRLAVVIAVLVGGYLIFEFGRIQADYNVVDAIDDQRAYEQIIADLENEISELKQEIALLETHKEIDSEAYKVVEANLSDLERKILEQDEAIAFYRGIL